ncbi:MAG TPA: glycosyltransferase family 39 protein [Candidatus Acidoferrum sp.]|nr:glycosyltransferase family 39 protein [Candidatus Acidoferrum sp.]
MRHRGWFLVGLTVLFALAVRVRLGDMPLERDEGEYAYAGQLMLHGLAPYKEAYTMKLPGTYAAYALSMGLFGQTPAGIHFGLALVNAASIILVYLLGRRLLDEATGIAAAVAFALLSLSPWVLGLAGHATHYVVVCALGGMLLLVRACERTGSAARGMEAAPDDAPRGTRSTGRPRPLSGLSSVFSVQLLALFFSGLLFGLAFLMKQHGLFFGLCGALYLLRTRLGQWFTDEMEEVPLADEQGWRVAKPELRAPQRRQAKARRFLRDAGLFALGGCLPYAVTCLVLWMAGALPAFVFWTFTYAARYASSIPLVSGPDFLRAGVHAVVGPDIVLWVLPWVGALVMWWEERLDVKRKPSLDRTITMAGAAIQPEEPELKPAARTRRSAVAFPRFFVTLLFLCSLASVSVGFYFRAHYFILLLPVLSLLIGLAVSRGLHLLRHDTTIELFLALAILGLFAIGIGAAVLGNGSVWFGMSPAEATRSIYGATLFADTARAAEYIKANSPPEARIAVLGSEPQIYFDARRRGATGYLYMYPLMEAHPYALKMQEQLIGEIERNQPEFIVYVDDDYSWLQRPDSERKLFDWWQDYWGKNMDLVQSLDVQENLERGAEVNNPMRRSRRHSEQQAHILVLQRRH